ncbi:MAG: DUF4065 domain-containing protein [Clostridia bacterium]|nr:DUF4065 domain-containing protein [Clostridia bacterium]
MNDTVLYDAYKKKKGLLTNSEIKNIRKKYEMNQKEFALVLGVGEVTVNRFENGAIQTEATDAIMRLSENPDNMYNLLLKNKMNIAKSSFEKYMNKIKELKSLQEHKLAKLDFDSLKKLSFETASSNDVANMLIKKYNSAYEKLGKEFKLDINCEYITHLKLQKLLYYVQGLCLSIFGKPAFTSKIYAFKYGPIVDEVYDKYKTSGKSSISTPRRVQELSEGLNEVIDIVLESYGKLDAYSLINFSHEEDP